MCCCWNAVCSIGLRRTLGAINSYCVNENLVINCPPPVEGLQRDQVDKMAKRGKIDLHIFCSYFSCLRLLESSKILSTGYNDKMAQRKCLHYALTCCSLASSVMLLMGFDSAKWFFSQYIRVIELQKDINQFPSYFIPLRVKDVSLLPWYLYNIMFITSCPWAKE